MATSPGNGHFASLLRARMREHDMDLDESAVDLLVSLEREHTAERRREGLLEGIDVDAQLRSEAETAVDRVLPRLADEFPVGTVLSARGVGRAIRDFFCPGLPPIC